MLPAIRNFPMVELIFQLEDLGCFEVNPQVFANPPMFNP